MSTYCGTPLNMAPEVMMKQNYTYKADIWSIGVMIFFMMTGTMPFVATTKSELGRKV
jgi:serine/threonine protein kinase